MEAAAVRERMDSGGVQTMAHLQHRPKEASAKRSPVPPVPRISPQAADCYWTYQARQLEVRVRG
jgi:hypothetical protein